MRSSVSSVVFASLGLGYALWQLRARTPQDKQRIAQIHRATLRLPEYRRYDPRRQAGLWSTLNQDEKREVLHISRDQLAAKLGDKFKKYYPDSHGQCVQRYIGEVIDTYKDSLLHSIAATFVDSVEHASSVWDLSSLQCSKAEGLIFGKAVIELFEENLDGVKTAIVQFRKYVAMGELRSATAVPLHYFYRHSVEYSLKVTFFVLLAWLAAATADFVLSSPLGLFGLPRWFFRLTLGGWIRTPPFVSDLQRYLWSYLPDAASDLLQWYWRTVIAGHSFEFGFLIFFHFLFLRKSMFVSFLCSCVEIFVAWKTWCKPLLLAVVWLVMLCISVYILYGMYNILYMKIANLKLIWTRVDKLFSHKKIRLQHATGCVAKATTPVAVAASASSPAKAAHHHKGSKLRATSVPPAAATAAAAAAVAAATAKRSGHKEHTQLQHTTTTTCITTTTTTTTTVASAPLAASISPAVVCDDTRTQAPTQEDPVKKTPTPQPVPPPVPPAQPRGKKAKARAKAKDKENDKEMVKEMVKERDKEKVKAKEKSDAAAAAAAATAAATAAAAAAAAAEAEEETVQRAKREATEATRRKLDNEARKREARSRARRNNEEDVAQQQQQPRQHRRRRSAPVRVGQSLQYYVFPCL
eukprot:TRINITY_DN2797_c0_g1_i3.p1 TRINITY_DN2797_c0_g1~~TRINITY_DN2797_c0_g1_i3.p1  ORF type:complete len:638 (+),score=182.56 TRINITY_DN2797_c0_g1_i3:107-2020(+)